MSYPPEAGPHVVVDLTFDEPSDPQVGPDVVVDLTFGATAGPGEDSTISITGRFSLRGSVGVNVDAGVHRGHSARTALPYQGASRQDAATRLFWTDSERRGLLYREPIQTAQRLDVSVAAPWVGTLPRAGDHVAIAWGAAQAQGSEAAVRWGYATRHRDRAAVVWQHANPAGASAAAVWQEGTYTRHALAAVWQEAEAHALLVGAPWHPRARVAHVLLEAPWRDAEPLTSWGGSAFMARPRPRPPGPTGAVVDLRFCEAYPEGGYSPHSVALVLGVDPCGLDGPPALIVIPIRSRYMTLNSLLLRRVDGDIELNSPGIDLSIDHRSWTWSWSAGLEKSALALLAPEDGDLVEMELSVNGVPYRLHAEDVERTRKFPKTSVASGGRGLAAELDAPVALQQYFSAASARTAQQLANEALTVNGVGIGWAIDWQLTDWLVPGGVWSHMGTHISAVSAIAAAAGGYVQPHPTARTLRVLPGYPAAPWDWAGLTPDIELPAAPVTLEGIRWQSRPAYDRVFVSGEGRSTIWDVTRGGTAGLIEAPMVVDQLATHADAARQRGIAVLGDTGRQALVTLSLPVLQETGLILPGKLVRYVDGPTTRIGLVRSCAIEWRRPRLRQRISLETHI